MPSCARPTMSALAVLIMPDAAARVVHADAPDAAPSPSAAMTPFAPIIAAPRRGALMPPRAAYPARHSALPPFAAARHSRIDAAMPRRAFCLPLSFSAVDDMPRRLFRKSMFHVCRRRRAFTRCRRALLPPAAAAAAAMPRAMSPPPRCQPTPFYARHTPRFTHRRRHARRAIVPPSTPCRAAASAAAIAQLPSAPHYFRFHAREMRRWFPFHDMAAARREA